MSPEPFKSRLTRLVGWLIGPRLTVYALAFLFVLTFWGTVYQVDHGLYAAQERFYNSWIILIGGFVPFPGTQLVLAILTVNLTAYLLAMIGTGGQRVYVVPSRGLAIIRLANGGTFSDAEFLERYFAAPNTAPFPRG